MYTRKRYKINKIRFVCSLIVISGIAILSVFSVFGAVINGINSNLCSDEICFADYTVTQGDSVWSIAAKCSDVSSDLREVVDCICSENKLHGNMIYPGQRIRIPQG